MRASEARAACGLHACGTEAAVLYAFGRALVCVFLVVAGVVAGARQVSALPSFARQTGQPCATCHNGAFPQLTPFGRQFKLNGYTSGGTRCRDSISAETGALQQNPISVMVVPTYTHTQKDLPGLPTNRDGDPNGLKTNNNVMVQDTSVFYGGQIYCQLGAFIQATYDRPDEAFFLDNTDIRFANNTKIGGVDLLYGLTGNNNPTVEDPWNTTPAWQIPGGGSITSAFAPDTAAPLIANVGGIVGGGGAYIFADQMFYALFGAYGTFDKDVLQALGEGPPSIGFDGPAPYWRLAIEKDWDVYSLMLGTFGIYANVFPDVTMASPTDKITDAGLDAQFQYVGDRHFFTARASYIYEWETLNGSVFLGAAANQKDHLTALNLSATYSYDATYTITAGYFNTQGSTDLNPITGASYFGTFNGSPNTEGTMIDIGYSPWNHGGPSIWPWLNTRFGLQYWHYNKIDGASTNYDGAGRNAGDDNTTLLYAWTAF